MQFFDGELRVEESTNLENASYTPGSIRRGKIGSIKPDPKNTPKTREMAAEQADTGNYDRSKRLDVRSSGKPTQVEIKTVGGNKDSRYR